MPLMPHAFVVNAEGGSGSAGLAYTYDDSSTSAADPGAGNLRLNDIPEDANEMYISVTDGDGVDRTDWLAQFGTAAGLNGLASETGTTRLFYLRITSIANPATYAGFVVDTVTAGSGFYEFSLDDVSYGPDPNTLLAGPCLLEFMPLTIDSPWELIVSDPLDTITDWTTDSGSWTNPGAYTQIDASGKARLRYTQSNWDLNMSTYASILEVEVYMDTAGSSTTDQRAGIKYGWDGAGGGAMLIDLYCDNNDPATTGKFDIEEDGVGTHAQINFNFNPNQFQVVRVMTWGITGTGYVNGGLRLEDNQGAYHSGSAARYFGILASNGRWRFRNFKAWGLRTP